MSPEIILLIILIAILYGIYSLIYYIKSNKEYFSAPVPYDLAAYLAAREEYDSFYNVDNGKTACKQTSNAPKLCSVYGGIVGAGYTYSPPLLYKGQNTAPKLTDSDFSGVKVQTNVQLESPVFTYYCPRPTSFNYSEMYNTKTPIERYIDENCRLMSSEVAASGYKTYMTVDKKNYEIKKAFTDIRDTLGCALITSAGRQLAVFVGVGLAAPTTYGRWREGDEASLFALLLRVTSQTDLNAKLAPPTASASAPASASGSEAAVAAVADAGSLQLPPLNYLPDARQKNKQLFDAMYRGIQTPSAALTSFYRNTSITSVADDYVTTVAKFIQLDKYILNGAMVGDVVDTGRLVGADGQPYKFQVPHPYNPAVSGAAADKESAADPLESAVDLKSYDLQDSEAAILTYFKSVRKYELSTMTNAQIADKLRESICASSGYYTNTNLSKCKCTTGCCIPVAYKAKSSCLAADSVKVQSVGLSAESQEMLDKVDNCVHLQSRFQIRRAAPVFQVGTTPTCIETREGFIDLPANYGGALGGASIRRQAQELKGWAMSPLGRAVSPLGRAVSGL